MSYRVTGKNLAVGRLMVRGKSAEPRLKYLHCGPQGMSVVTPTVVARVSLPEQEGLPLGALIYPQTDVDAMKRPAPESPEIVTMPEGEPAVDSARYMVPKIEQCLFEADASMPSFIVNGDTLRKLLTVACEVCDDSEKVMRLRYDKVTNSLRIDTYRQPGGQEFVGVMKCMRYTGGYIPGDVAANAPSPEQKPEQGNLVLKMTSGRKFRGEGE